MTRSCSRTGMFYPRAGTLGGCTAHNAMILAAPHDADWDAIAALTNDASWGASAMQPYFHGGIESLPSCVACVVAPGLEPDWTWLGRLAANRACHAVAGARGSAAVGSRHRVPRSQHCMAHRAWCEHCDACCSRDWTPTIGACCGATPTDCASRHSPPTDTNGWERANACSTSQRAIRTGCGSSCMRWRHA